MVAIPVHKTELNSAYRSRCRQFDSQPGHITCVENDHDIFSMAILPSSRFKRGACHLLTEGKYAHKLLSNHLEDEVCPVKLLILHGQIHA